jgi:hypothetical protein
MADIFFSGVAIVERAPKERLRSTTRSLRRSPERGAAGHRPPSTVRHLEPAPWP